MVDHGVRFVGLIGYSVPIFWLGLMGLLVFYAKLEWLPGPDASISAMRIW